MTHTFATRVEGRFSDALLANLHSSVIHLLQMETNLSYQTCVELLWQKEAQEFRNIQVYCSQSQWANHERTRI